MAGYDWLWPWLWLWPFYFCFNIGRLAVFRVVVFLRLFLFVFCVMFPFECLRPHGYSVVAIQSKLSDELNYYI